MENDILDPTGWTTKNNPHPNKYADPTDENDWRNWHEWDEDSFKPIKCHMCILRAQHKSGNCVNGGEYWICLPRDVREGKRKLPKPTIQSKLL